jgi:hypothetical protein
LIEEVIIAVHKDEHRSHLTLRWRGGALAEIDLDLPRRRFSPVRTDEDTAALVRRLAVPIPTPSLPARQQRTTAYGHRFHRQPQRQSASPLEHRSLRAASHNARR